MIGSLAGDLFGSAFEFHNDINNHDDSLFSNKSRFTDDSVLTTATADAILNHRPYSEVYYEYAVQYPNRGYGKSFSDKIKSGKLEAYGSYGNGSAMRVGPIGHAFSKLSEVLEESKKSAECSHNSIEGIKGAQAIAHSIWACRNFKKQDKPFIKDIIENVYDYGTIKKCSEFEKKFDITCQGTVPRCIAIFLETSNFVEAMKKSIEMGGDVDTNCCIVGSICDAYYGLPDSHIIQFVYERIPKEIAEVTTKFVKKYIQPDFQSPLFVDNKIDNSILSLEIL
jgi:ADP-ribosylglycohydrolase